MLDCWMEPLTANFLGCAVLVLPEAYTLKHTKSKMGTHLMYRKAEADLAYRIR